MARQGQKGPTPVRELPPRGNRLRICTRAATRCCRTYAHQPKCELKFVGHAGIVHAERALVVQATLTWPSVMPTQLDSKRACAARSGSGAPEDADSARARESISRRIGRPSPLLAFFSGACQRAQDARSGGRTRLRVQVRKQRDNNTERVGSCGARLPDCTARSCAGATAVGDGALMRGKQCSKFGPVHLGLFPSPLPLAPGSFFFLFQSHLLLVLDRAREELRDAAMARGSSANHFVDMFFCPISMQVRRALRPSPISPRWTRATFRA